MFYAIAAAVAVLAVSCNKTDPNAIGSVEGDWLVVSYKAAFQKDGKDLSSDEVMELLLAEVPAEQKEAAKEMLKESMGMVFGEHAVPDDQAVVMCLEKGGKLMGYSKAEGVESKREIGTWSQDGSKLTITAVDTEEVTSGTFTIVKANASELVIRMSSADMDSSAIDTAAAESFKKYGVEMYSELSFKKI